MIAIRWQKEYHRDVKAGLDPDVPKNYFDGDDANTEPRIRWNLAATTFFSNWIPTMRFIKKHLTAWKNWKRYFILWLPIKGIMTYSQAFKYGNLVLPSAFSLS